MQGYRRSRKEFSWSRCTVDNVEFSLIYSIYSFNRDYADCVGRLIHLCLIMFCLQTEVLILYKQYLHSPVEGAVVNNMQKNANNIVELMTIHAECGGLFKCSRNRLEASASLKRRL